MLVKPKHMKDKVMAGPYRCPHEDCERTFDYPNGLRLHSLEDHSMKLCDTDFCLREDCDGRHIIAYPEIHPAAIQARRKQREAERSARRKELKNAK